MGVINLGMTGYVWMGFNLNKGSLQSLLSNSDFNNIVPNCKEPRMPSGILIIFRKSLSYILAPLCRIE